jgi:hypothetical protein
MILFRLTRVPEGGILLLPMTLAEKSWHSAKMNLTKVIADMQRYMFDLSVCLMTA